MTWRTFVQAHWSALLAADFFTTEVWTTRGLVTYYTAFVIELHSRRPYSRHHAIPGRGLCYADSAANDRLWHRYFTQRSHPDLRSRSEMESRSRAAAADVGRPHGPDAGVCTQLQCVRRTIRAVDQGGVPKPDRAAGRPASAKSACGVRRALSQRAESPGAQE